MRQAFGTLTAASIIAAAAKARHSSPFVGEHRDAGSINHGEGNVTMKMKPTAAPWNKYESMLAKEGLFQDRWTYVGSAKEAIFGKEESNLDRAIAAKKEGRKVYSGRSHKLGQDTIAGHELTNLDGTMWTGEIYMGGNTLMDVVYDTGSDWLVVEGNSCSSCEGNKYNPANSESTAEKQSGGISERNYGSASLTGYEYKDRVCLQLDSCLDDFEFFLIESQTGIAEPIDGILGLARNNAFHIAPDNGNTSGPLYVEALFDGGIINANKFSFYFQHPEEDSWMDLGEPDLSHVAEGFELKETQLIDPDFFWAFYNTGVAFGDIKNAYAYTNTKDYPVFIEGTSIYSIIDTGSTALMISALYYESLIKNLFAEAGIDDWEFTQGVVTTKCTYSLPSVFFLIDKYWVEARAEDYLYDYGNNGKDCLLFILPMNSPMNILGMPVFVDYYSIHDPITGIVSWAPHTNSVKGEVQLGKAPTNKFLTIGEA